MSQFEEEVEKNRQSFHADWTASIQTNWKSLKENDLLKDSYRRISCLNALRNLVVDKKLDKASGEFFLEAHNDALVSHVNASFGAWRPALQALRSCIENSLAAFYYKDHPVELELWTRGEARLGFSELESYFSKHPVFREINKKLTGLEILTKEYSVLSRAVHASAKSFRMTDKASETLLWNADPARAGMWSTREGLVVQGVGLFVIAFFRDEFTGMKNAALREVLYYVLSEDNIKQMQTDLKIVISKPS
jgi:hypothetical protein